MNEHGRFPFLTISYYEIQKIITSALVGFSIGFSTGIGEPITTLIGRRCGSIPNLKDMQ